MSNLDDIMSPSKPVAQEVLPDGVVKIRDKLYRTVALRIHLFREDHPDWSLRTNILFESDDLVRMQCVVSDRLGHVIATGMAQERVAGSAINKTSHIENCETSCVGRALAFMGYGGQEIASAQEMEQALEKQSQDNDPLAAHNRAKEANKASIEYIKEGIKNDDMLAVAEAWIELTNDDKEALWVAPSKGGVFTTYERKILKSNEFYNATKEVIK